MIKVFPTLYEQSSTGKIKHWTISVELIPADTVIIFVRYGIEGSKDRLTQKQIKKGKNIGRSNETTPYEQALSEAEATWKKKLDKGYVEDLSAIHDEVLLPMLAHTFQKRGHNISYPAYVQPKLDGVRCLAKKTDATTIKYYSRMGKEFNTLEHLTPALLKIMKVDQVLDGEIYSHNDLTFQEMIRLVKKLRPDSKRLEYHVYDLVDTTKTFSERLSESALMVLKARNKSIVNVLTETIKSSKDIATKHTEYISEGYEGVIIRNSDGKYKLNGRSADLQKYKEFQDSEFTITGGQESTGSEAGCVIFNVKNDKGITFAVRPRGSFDQRRKWMKDINNLIGKKLTVRYQELTDDGVPRFPVGISIRDYEN